MRDMQDVEDGLFVHEEATTRERGAEKLHPVSKGGSSVTVCSAHTIAIANIGIACIKPFDAGPSTSRKPRSSRIVVYSMCVPASRHVRCTRSQSYLPLSHRKIRDCG